MAGGRPRRVPRARAASRPSRAPDLGQGSGLPVEDLVRCGHPQVPDQGAGQNGWFAREQVSFVRGCVHPWTVLKRVIQSSWTPGLRGTVSRTWSRWRQPGIRPVVDHVHVTPGCSASPATRSTSTCPRSPPPELYPTPTYPPRRRQPHELIATPATAPAPWSGLGLFLPMVLTGPYHARWVVWRN